MQRCPEAQYRDPMRALYSSISPGQVQVDVPQRPSPSSPSAWPVPGLQLGTPH